WTCDLAGAQCTAAPRRRDPVLDNGVVAPDGKRVAFIRDYNLWARELASGQETQLTTDGVKDFGYATDNAGWIRSDHAVLAWSPDSKKVATFNRTSAAWARCTSSRPAWATRCLSSGSTRSRATA